MMVPSDSSAWPVRTSLTPVPEVDLHALLGQHLGHVAVGLVENGVSSASP